jgi:hypothetical protein
MTETLIATVNAAGKERMKRMKGLKFVIKDPARKTWNVWMITQGAEHEPKTQAAYETTNEYKGD